MAKSPQFGTFEVDSRILKHDPMAALHPMVDCGITPGCEPGTDARTRNEARARRLPYGVAPRPVL